MHYKTFVESLMAYTRLGVCACAFAVFSVVSAPTLLADSIYNFDFHVDSDALSSTPSDSGHGKHDSLVFKNSLLSEESSFSADPSLFASFGREDHSLHADSLADERNRGLHLGWGTGVEHNHHHHYDGGTTNGNSNLPTDPVAEPEPSTTVSLLFGLAIVLFFSSRKRVSGQLSERS